MLGTNQNLLPELEAEYDRLIGRVRGLVDTTEPAALNRRPGDGWSAAECIDHLTATARLYLEPFEEAIADARRDGLTGDRADGRTLLGRLVAWSMEPPPRLKMKTFGELKPGEELDPGRLAEEFAAVHEALVRQMAGAADLDRKRVKVRSLLDSRLKLSLDDWYAFLAAHARRHLWQAERALKPHSHEP